MHSFHRPFVQALSASNPDLTGGARESARRQAGRRGPYGGRDLLVILEMALAVVLVVSSGLIGAFFMEMNRIERRFDAGRVLAVELDLPEDTEGGDKASARQLTENILASVSGLPGVEAAAVADGAVVFSGRAASLVPEACRDEAGPRVVPVLRVGTGYFRVMGLPILAGRAIGDEDISLSPSAAAPLRDAWAAARRWAPTCACPSWL